MNIVKEAVNVKINGVVQMLYLHEPTALSNGMFCRAVWAKAIGTLMELRLADWFKDLQDTLLYNSINDCGYAQRSGFAIGFWETPEKFV